MKKDNKLYTKILMAVLGIFVLGISVGLTQYATLGVDPFTSFVTGVGNMVGLSFSKIYPIITGLIIVIIFVFDKSLIGVITFLNMLLIGPLADFSRTITSSIFNSPDTPTRFFILALGLILMGLGVSLCNNSDLGTGPYDTLSLILSDRSPRLDFKFARIVIDIFCVIIGLIGKANVGIGTVLNAIIMGYIISFFDKNVSHKFYIRK